MHVQGMNNETSPDNMLIAQVPNELRELESRSEFLRPSTQKKNLAVDQQDLRTNRLVD